MIVFTFCNNNAEPQSAYLQRIVLGKPYTVSPTPRFDMLSSKVFKFVDKDGGISSGQPSYTAKYLGNTVAYQSFDVDKGPFLYTEGDEAFIMKKDLMGDEAYFIPSREIFKKLFGVDVPSVICSIVHLKERGYDSLHLYIEDEHVVTLIGRHTQQPNMTTIKKHHKKILEKLRDEFWVLDNVVRTKFTLPNKDTEALWPTLRDNFAVYNESINNDVEMSKLPSVTCPYIRWNLGESKLFFSLAELEGVETPIKGVRSFRGNALYFEQLVNWYYTIALMGV